MADLPNEPAKAALPETAAAEAPVLETPAAAAAPVEGAQPPQAAVPVSTRTMEDVLANGTEKELREFLRNPERLEGLAQEPEAEAKTAESKAAEASEVEAGKLAETEAAAKAEAAKAEEAASLPDRIRITNLPENDKKMLFAARSLAEVEGIPLAEAFARLAKPAAQAAAGAAAAAPVKTEAEVALEKVNNLKAQLKEATVAFDADKAAELQVELAQAIADQRFAEHTQAQAAAASQQTAEQQWKAAEAETFKTLETRFPDLQTAGTPLNTAVNARLAEIEARNPEFFNDPKWLSYVANDVAAELGVQPVPKATPAAAAAPKAAAGAAPARAAVAAVVPRQAGHPAAIPPAPGNPGGANTNTGPDVEKLAGSSNLKELMGALRAGGTHQRTAA